MKKASRGTEKRKIPLEQRAHFYTGASPVCALCEADSPDFNRPGCFASLRSVQGAAPLAPLCGYPCVLCDWRNLLTQTAPLTKF